MAVAKGLSSQMRVSGTLPHAGTVELPTPHPTADKITAAIVAIAPDGGRRHIPRGDDRQANSPQRFRFETFMLMLP
ncbi:MAG: hypothetical protein SWY16_03125 [Cyanobacteriota bacterium]|nr:hypothetical protein [Cyanobacteriota bacterium]